MKIHHIGILILVVCGLTLGSLQWINSLSDNYDKPLDTSTFNKTQTQLNEQNYLVEELKLRIGNFTLSKPTDSLSIPYDMLQTGWTLSKLMFTGVKTIIIIITDLFNALIVQGLGIPAWAVLMFIGIVVLTIAGIMIYALMKWYYNN